MEQHLALSPAIAIAIARAGMGNYAHKTMIILYN